MTTRAHTLLLSAILTVAALPAFAHGNHEIIASTGQGLSYFLPSIAVAGAMIAAMFGLPSLVKSGRD